MKSKFFDRHYMQQILLLLKRIYNKIPFSYQTRVSHKKILRKISPRLLSSVEIDIPVTNPLDKFDANEHSNKKDTSVMWGILTPLHTLTLAQTLSQQLTRHGVKTQILVGEQAEFTCEWYLVLCPQIFKKLPPPEKRILYQLEQSVSSRWFNTQYIENLQNSYAVLDYSLDNIEYLSTIGISYPHIHYLPIGPLDGILEKSKLTEKKYDILFYGDSLSSPRRRSLLEKLKSKFNVVEINDCFGQEMREKICESRLVINLHYYENSLLETTRIMECISLGVPVISESTSDMSNYPELLDAVQFFPSGNAEAMLEIVDKVLRSETNADVDKSVEASKLRLNFMFDRFLMALGFLSSDYISKMPSYLPSNLDVIALSLPETIQRRRRFEELQYDSFIFDGIRRSPGWIGCGMSYQYICQYGLQNNLKNLTVMEDDVILPVDFKTKYGIINRYLQKVGDEWDLFSGLIASLHEDVEILDVENFEGVTFVTVNKMTSMVFNIYSQKFMRHILAWDPKNIDADYNTIDRFIENTASLRIVITYPYLVGHHEETHSTLWGFQNTQYSDMIADSEKRMGKLIKAFNEKKSSNA